MRLLIGFLVLLNLAAPAFAGLFSSRVYEPMPLPRFRGYKDSVQADGTVRVFARSSDVYDGRGFSYKVALYRAATIAQSSKSEYLQLLSARVVTTWRDGFETATLITRPATTAAPPPNCVARTGEPCVTLKADEIISEIGPQMKFKVGQPALP